MTNGRESCTVVSKMTFKNRQVKKNDGNDNPLSCRVTFCLQASLIGHMDNLGLLKSNTVFMEFGAGRGRYLLVAVIENSCSHPVLSINSSTLKAVSL